MQPTGSKHHNSQKRIVIEITIDPDGLIAKHLDQFPRGQRSAEMRRLMGAHIWEEEYQRLTDADPHARHEAENRLLTDIGVREAYPILKQAQ